MKKIININLSGRVIPIEDAAYESLQRYIESLRRYFINEEGRDEIINDIESRIAELMDTIIKKGASVVTEADVDEIIQSMGRIEDFEAASADEASASATSSTASGATNFTFGSQAQGSTYSRGRLYRNESDKFLGGVCSGLANYLNLDPTIVRFFFAIVTFGGFGIGILIYILLWILLPIKNLDTFVGKRLFRNPDDRIISGVAGGIAAFTNISSRTIRFIFATPLLLNILFGTVYGIFNHPWHPFVYPNFFVGSFSGTFIMIYIILWIVLPEAKSSFEKMEMRGEKVDVDSIRQNVKVEMGNLKKNVKDEVANFKVRTEAWSKEVQESAQKFSAKATDFASSRGKSFASEVTTGASHVGKSIGHVIGVLFRAFFIFIAAVMTLALLGLLIFLIFGGVAWWPINDFLWSSNSQKFLAWSTILLFFTVPVIAFMVWLVRRILRVRSRSPYLGWTFGGLWTLGWFCAISLAVSITKDLRVYDRTITEVPVTQPVNGKMIIRVNEPVVHYNGSGWINDDGSHGWDVSNDTMRYNNVKVRIRRSDDSLFHVHELKYSAGESLLDAQRRADRTVFNISSVDSILNIGSGLAFDKNSKFRGQGIILEIDVPVGKEIRFDESLRYAYDYGFVRKYDTDHRFWGPRYSYKNEWNEDEYLNWAENTDYVMTSDGKLTLAQDAIKTKKGIFEPQTSADSLQKAIEERSKQNEKDRIKLDELKNEKSGTIHIRTEAEQVNFASFTQMHQPFVPLII